MRWESPLESGVRSSPSGEHPCHLLTFSPFRPGGPAGPRGPGSPGRPCKREHLSPWGCNSALGTHSHLLLIPSANPVGLGAGLTGGPGSPRGAAPSTSPGGPCRDKCQLLCGCPEGSVLPSTLRGYSALGHSRDPPSRRAEESGKGRATHPFPSVTLLSLQGQKNQIRAVLGCPHALLE